MKPDELTIDLHKDEIEKQNKNLNFNLLRIVLAWMVVIRHVGAEAAVSSDFSGVSSFIVIFLNSIVRMAVPIFIMLSGYFNLRKETSPSLQKILKKMAYYFILYLSWSCFYAFQEFLIFHRTAPTQMSMRSFVGFLVAGYYHLWYLPTFIYVYAISPFFFALKKYENGSYVKYFVILFLIFGILKKSTIDFLALFDHPSLQALFLNFTIFSLTSFGFYYLYGYYVSNLEIKLKKSLLFLLLILINLLSTTLTTYFSGIKGHFVEAFCDLFSIDPFLQATLMFKIFENIKNNEYLQKHSEKVRDFADLALGIYLIHPVFVRILMSSSLQKYSMTPLFILISSSLIFLMSAALIFVLKKIPLIKKLV